jgi:hypothetical protein
MVQEQAHFLQRHILAALASHPSIGMSRKFFRSYQDARYANATGLPWSKGRPSHHDLEGGALTAIRRVLVSAVGVDGKCLTLA